MLLRMKSGWSASGRFGTLVCGAALLAGCATSPAFDTGTGLLGWNLPSAGEETKPKTLAELQRAHAEKPRDPDTTVAYSRALKSNGKPREALAVVEAAAQASPDNQKLVVEQGLLAVNVEDHRLTWPERELVKQLGEKLYGKRIEQRRSA